MVDGASFAWIEAGATLQRAPDGEIEWWILTDPEGNEFCAFAPDDDWPLSSSKPDLTSRD